MSNAANKLIQAAAGNAGEAVYVDDVFNIFLYTGTDANNITATTGLDMSGEGGMVYFKGRSATEDGMMVDSARGVDYGIYTTGTGGQFSISGLGFAAPTFTSTGFTVGDAPVINRNTSDEYVAWSFRKQPGFFDVVTYTGDGTSGRTVNHNLGSVPGMMIVKRTSANEKWSVYHRSADGSAPEDKYLVLNDTAAVADNDNIWNDTAPTSTQFTVGSDAMVNGNTDTYVAYLFAHDAQDFGENSDEAIIKCGSYSGNSGTQTIDVGFEPQWVMIKNTTSGSTDWFVVDVMRGLFDTSAVDAALIRANEADPEQTSGAGGARITPKNNGFGFLTESNLSCNRSGETYIYVAIRRPHKPASEFAATDLFNVDLGDANDPGFDTGFPVDMGIFRTHESTADFDVMARLTGPRRLDITTGTEANKANATFDYMDGWVSSGMASHIGWAWRRAPGYFDATSHTSNGQPTQQITHNLGVAPEMAWIKIRSTTGGWFVYHKDLSAGKNCFLDTNAAETTSNTTTAATFTSTHWTPGDDGYYSGGSNTQTYMAYLFATVAGISKVGSYSGTGSDVNVDCGFSAGARFVLIKRSDSTGDWYLYDSVRGIVAGDDPYLLLNSTAAQVTNTDYIDPLSSGFTITSSAPAALNTSGGTYIFLAIA
tara:strand:- start:2021 stop:3976 length:1956 start_codon:yes stop_codon:yes gene_type:complete